MNEDAARTPDDADADGGAGAPPAATPGSRRGRSRRGRRRRPRPLWKELVVLAVVAAVIALLTKTFLVQLFYIPSGSMEETLQIGDRVAVNKLVYRFGDVQRGDVVVFDGTDSFSSEVTVPEPSNPVSKVLRPIASAVGLGPTSEKDFIKRVIGVGGDRVVCCDDQDRLTVNGVALDEPYVFPGNKPSTDEFDVVVPEGKLWVMGDHRAASSDSRSRIGSPGGGFVSEDKVIGKAFAVVWPVGSIGGIHRPDTFDQQALSALAAIEGSAAAPAAALAAALAVRCPFVLGRRRPGRPEEDPRG
jgi:signal peptidase I